MVRLLPVFAEAQKRWNNRPFNPTMVRLLLWQQIAERLSELAFNPTMVRLLLVAALPLPLILMTFNPTMVRLLPLWSALRSLWSVFFQSHNGAIAAATNTTRLRDVKSAFNPTMVRLLPRQNFGV